MLIMLIFCPFRASPPPKGPQGPQKINMINISPVLSAFFEDMD